MNAYTHIHTCIRHMHAPHIHACRHRNAPICTCTHQITQVHAQTHMCTHTRVYMHPHTHAHTKSHTRMHRHTCAQAYKHICTQTRIHTETQTYQHVNTHTNVHTHTRARRTDTHGGVLCPDRTRGQGGVHLWCVRGDKCRRGCEPAGGRLLTSHIPGARSPGGGGRMGKRVQVRPRNMPDSGPGAGGPRCDLRPVPLPAPGSPAPRPRHEEVFC